MFWCAAQAMSKVLKYTSHHQWRLEHKPVEQASSPDSPRYDRPARLPTRAPEPSTNGDGATYSPAHGEGAGWRWSTLFAEDMLRSEGFYIVLLAVAGASPTGVAGVRTPHFWKPRGRLPRNLDISVTIFLKRLNVCIFQHFQNIVNEIRYETKYWG